MEHVAAQEPVDRATSARIREEGFQRSQVMTFAEYMTDVPGPRLTGSPGLRRAEQWAKTTMTGLGLINVAIEPWGEHGVGWTNTYTSLHLIEPTYQPVIGYPLAFTPCTSGKVTGEARVVSIGTEADFAKYRGKLAGAIVLRFFKSENVGVVLQGAPGQDGTVFVDGRPGSRQDRSYRGVMESPPIVALAAEHYDRIYRVAAQRIPARVEIEIRNALDTSVTTADNVTGEIAGSDLNDQIVMLGDHFDSWHSAIGATDDAAGVAVALEAMRILRRSGENPADDSCALWSYEEGGVVGSRRTSIGISGPPISLASSCSSRRSFSTPIRGHPNGSHELLLAA